MLQQSADTAPESGEAGSHAQGAAANTSAANDSLEAQYWSALSPSSTPASTLGNGTTGQAELCKVYYLHTDQVGMPQELTNAQGQVIWQASYKTWGSTVAEEWEVKNLSGDAVHPLDAGDSPNKTDQQQNLRFQGQYLDRDTGLHYNTFRYYDPDMGRFICPDPIGLIGGTNLSLYGGNTQTWVDPLGLKGELWGGSGQPATFGEWFDGASVEQVRDAMANSTTKEQITAALRNGGGMHEWFPVSMAEKAKELGFTVEELKKLSTPTGDVWFQNIPDPRNPGAVLEGPHSQGKKLPPGQSGRASSIGHDILIGSLEGASSKRSAITRIRSFVDRFVRGGRAIIGKSC